MPLFFALASYQDFSLLMIPGFLTGLTAGALVLTSIYNGSGGSILAVAVWHAAYNLGSATTAADGTVAAIVTACVIFWAVSLVQRERAGQPALARAEAAQSGRHCRGRHHIDYTSTTQAPTGGSRS